MCRFKKKKKILQFEVLGLYIIGKGDGKSEISAFVRSFHKILPFLTSSWCFPSRWLYAVEFAVLFFKSKIRILRLRWKHRYFCFRCVVYFSPHSRRVGQISVAKSLSLYKLHTWDELGAIDIRIQQAAASPR